MCAGAFCIGSNIKNCFGASDEHRGFVKMELQFQNRRKTGVLAEEASDLMKPFTKRR
jgi:tRNA(adenine34) deaminase